MNAEKSKLYKTARATLSCAAFAAGEFLAVRFSHQAANGVCWFDVTATERGALDRPIPYPAHHLANFVL